ncbi:MAG TPA: hypothetical protein VGK93_05315 [Candidatus Eisenbacteria bacterium]
MYSIRPSSWSLALVLAASLALGPANGFAESADQVPLGARALAMGGAFCSIADDATASYWNPAGLPWIGHQEITGAHANLFNTGIKDNFAAFVLPLSPRHAAAIDWYHSGFEDTELDFGENRIDLSYGRKVAAFLSAGATLKYLTRRTSLDGVSVRRGQGVGADLGMLATPLDRLRLALILQDAFDTKLSYAEGNGTVVAYPRRFRVGASYGLFKDALLALDVDDRYHLGAEYQALPQLALRAGLEEDPDASDGITTSFGAGIKFGLLRFDYALVDHPVLGSTSHFGLSMAFNFNPAQIRIEKVEARDLYGSLYKTYAREPFGSVLVRNLDDKPIAATVRVFVPELMGAPSDHEVVLRPKAAQPIALTAVFSEDVMRQRGDRPVQVEVSASYQSRRLPRTEKASARCVAYGPGAIDWSAGVAQAAAFVTSRDPVVDGVARQAVRVAAAEGEGPPAGRNIAHAAALFDALGTLGITYVPDPNNPYSSIAETPRAVDAVSYPRETLARRTGDCDDTSVLYAALLGNVGISTQLVDVPGHLFLLVDTGVHERNRLSLALDESRYVVNDEEVWIPVETTALKEGFAQAWRAGAEAYASWAARGKLALVDVDESQSRYEPADVPGEPAAAPQLDAARLTEQTRADFKAIDEWRAAFLAGRYEGAQKGLVASPEALNEIAHVYLVAGKLDEAEAKLEQALTVETNPARTHNNLANVLAAKGDVPGALQHYQASLVAEEKDAGPWLNLGLVRYASGDTLGAEEPLAKGMALSGGYDAACRLLGLAPEVGAEREGAEKMSQEEARQLLKAALRKVPAPGVASKPEPIQPPAGSQRRWTSRIAAGRAGEAALANLLYWKP